METFVRLFRNAESDKVPEIDPDILMQSLIDAYGILKKSSEATAGGPMPIWLYPHNAQKHIEAQIANLLRR